MKGKRLQFVKYSCYNEQRNRKTDEQDVVLELYCLERRRLVQALQEHRERCLGGHPRGKIDDTDEKVHFNFEVN